MEPAPTIRYQIRAELLPATQEGLEVLADTAAVRAEVRRAGGLNPIARVIWGESHVFVTYEVEGEDAQSVVQRAEEVIRATASAFWGDAITWRIL